MYTQSCNKKRMGDPTPVALNLVNFWRQTLKDEVCHNIGNGERRASLVLNRDTATNLMISSPLEAHKSLAIIHHIICLDVGSNNPMYGALEVDYP